MKKRSQQNHRISTPEYLPTMTKEDRELWHMFGSFHLRARKKSEEKLMRYWFAS
jgi:hypothetical protein